MTQINPANTSPMTKGNGERVFLSLIFSGVSTVAVTDALARLLIRRIKNIHAVIAMAAESIGSSRVCKVIAIGSPLVALRLQILQD